MAQNRKIRVLIVDDSASVRQALKEILESRSARSKSWGSPSDPYVAVEHIEREVPDVITLDVEMPRMDGLTFLEKIMAQHPIPVVICSSLTEAGLRHRDGGPGMWRGRDHYQAEAGHEGVPGRIARHASAMR